MDGWMGGWVDPSMIDIVVIRWGILTYNGTSRLNYWAVACEGRLGMGLGVKLLQKPCTEDGGV